MKGNTTKEIIELANAFDNGKELEYFCHSIKQWLPYCPTFPSFNFNHYTYRIKPKEKKRVKLYQFLCENNGNFFYSSQVFPSLQEAKKLYNNAIKQLDHTMVEVETYIEYKDKNEI